MALLGKGGEHSVLICCVATAAVFVTLTRGGPVYMQHSTHSCMDIQPSPAPFCVMPELQIDNDVFVFYI